MRFKPFLATLLLMAFLPLATVGGAAPAPEDLVKYRQNVMKAQGGHAGAAALILRGKVDYMPQLIDHARALAASTATVKDIFPEGSDVGDTAAKPEIWQQPEEFSKASVDAEKAAAAFLQSVESGNKEEMAARFKDLGQACKGCHDKFRKKEE